MNYFISELASCKYTAVYIHRWMAINPTCKAKKRSMSVVYIHLYPFLVISGDFLGLGNVALAFKFLGEKIAAKFGEK